MEVAARQPVELAGEQARDAADPGVDGSEMMMSYLRLCVEKNVLASSKTMWLRGSAKALLLREKKRPRRFGHRGLDLDGLDRAQGARSEEACAS